MDQARKELKRLEELAARGGDALSEEKLLAEFISFTRDVLTAAKGATKKLQHQRKRLTRFRNEMIGLQNIVHFQHPEAVEERQEEQLRGAEKEALERLREAALLLHLFERGLEEWRQHMRDSGERSGEDDGDDGDTERMLRSHLDDLDNRLKLTRYQLGKLKKGKWNAEVEDGQDLLAKAEENLLDLERQLQEMRKRRADLEEMLDDCRRNRALAKVIRFSLTTDPPPPPSLPSPPLPPTPTPEPPSPYHVSFPTKETTEEENVPSIMQSESLINMQMRVGPKPSLMVLVDESERFVLEAERNLEQVKYATKTGSMSADEAWTALATLGRKIVEFVESIHQEMDERSLTLLEIRNEIRELEQMYEMSTHNETQEEHLQVESAASEDDPLQRMRADMFAMEMLAQRLQERREELLAKGWEIEDDGDENDDTWQLRNDIQVREIRLQEMYSSLSAQTGERAQGALEPPRGTGDVLPQAAMTFVDTEIQEARTDLRLETEQVDHLQWELDACLEKVARNASPGATVN